MTAAGGVVDAHHHLWDLPAGHHRWLSDAPDGTPEATLAAQAPHYGPTEYRRDVEAWGVVATVHVQADWDPADPAGETRWLQELHDRTGTPDAIVGQARLQSPDVEEVLRSHLRHPLFRGIRQTLAWGEPEGLMSSRAWRRGFAQLEALGLSFDMSVLPGQLVDAAALARVFPGTSIVLDHAGLPEPVGADRAVWRDGLRRLAECENVTVKVSGITQPRRSTAEIEEDAAEVIETFGCHRAMFATNLPVEHLEGSVQSLVDALDAVLVRRPDDERTAVWAGTATRVYRLPESLAAA